MSLTYEELNTETRDFVNFTTKTYQLLVEKMKDGKYNKNIFHSSYRDVALLALYIASSFYNTKADEFYVWYGFSLEEVLEILNIPITKEEIDSQELNQKVAIDKFSRFVYGGINVNKKPSDITIDDVAMNLCNRACDNSEVIKKSL